jgi:peptide chain release factor 1
MIDKLAAAERTFKELQLRMSDPDVAANATEFQKVRGAPHLQLSPVSSVHQ